MPSSYQGAQPICISGMTEGSQQLAVLGAKVSLTGDEWQKYPIVTGLEAPYILGSTLRTVYFKDLKEYWWVFVIPDLRNKKVKQLSILSGLSENSSVVRLLRVKEQRYQLLGQSCICTNIAPRAVWCLGAWQVKSQQRIKAFSFNKFQPLSIQWSRYFKIFISWINQGKILLLQREGLLFKYLCTATE